MALDIPNLDVESGDEDNIPMIPSPVAGTATTPSEIQEDDRMELPRLSPIPPEPTHPTPDTVMAPPPPPPLPPSLNFIPATPQHSQEAVRSKDGSLEPGEIALAPTVRPRARSRTPFGLQPIASSSRLEPPTTRSRSRSKTPF